jgi:hypothetical protein
LYASSLWTLQHLYFGPDVAIFLPKADRLTIVYNGYEPASMGIRMPDTGKMPSRHAP